MQKQYTCFFITPIGKAGSEINEIANEVYETLVIPALIGCNVRHLRGDENLNSNHIGMDVIQCVRDADLCLVDISYPNCNVYYELGLADALEKPVILMKEAEVNAADLPADVASRKYVEYSIARGRTAASRRDIAAAVRLYIEKMENQAAQQPAKMESAGDLPAVRALIEENYALRRQLEEKEASAPALKLPMDLRPAAELTPMQAAQKRELIEQLDNLARLDRKASEPSAQMQPLLQQLRRLVGDAEYLHQLQARSYSAGVWKEYLRCAVAWTEVDIARCALDVSWLPALMSGIENNFADDSQYAQVETVIGRILTMSSEYRDMTVMDENGAIRQYDSVAASYYRGMLSYYAYLKTGEKRDLWDASLYWSSWKERERAETRFDARWKQEKKIEASLLLAKTRYLRGEDEKALRNLQEALSDIDAVQGDQRWLHLPLEDAYGLSVCLGDVTKEKTAEIIRRRFPKLAEDMMHSQRFICKRLKINHLFARIAAQVHLPQMAVQKFEELFKLQRNIKSPLFVTENTTATAEQLDAFVQEIKELLTDYQTDVDCTEFLAQTVLYLLKVKDTRRNAYREHIQLQVKLISELEGSTIAQMRELQEAKAEVVQFCSPGETDGVKQFNVLALKIYLDHMGIMKEEYPEGSKELKALEALENLLRPVLETYEEMDSLAARMIGMPGGDSTSGGDEK